ncbi:hypothetical protein [Arsenicicoccus dermatophilus]|uniref:hypothetical protein n=1 Tax=Arsenicicoccus dermatophilus TaxID=1076331 RepID=UPI001F4C8B73|nr:hypothetical protein [Arsenicicoccus dermatophilus]MCH8613467.1 hypothetical protein [Arsenicicoccus dermatophilus]
MTVPAVEPPSLERQVRLLIADTSVQQYLTSQDVADFLALNGGNVRLAAADACEAIATSEALVGKKITTQDLATDGTAVADALMKRAALLRRQAKDKTDEDAGDDWACVVVGGISDDPYGRRPELTEWPTVTGM